MNFDIYQKGFAALASWQCTEFTVMLITVNEAAPGGAASLQGQFQLHAAGVTGMLLLTHVLLILWISSVGGQGKLKA